MSEIYIFMECFALYRTEYTYISNYDSCRRERTAGERRVV